jgi:hypothetical protein
MNLLIDELSVCLSGEIIWQVAKKKPEMNERIDYYSLHRN